MEYVSVPKMKAKPDCSGQKFGMLTVLGKGSKKNKGRIRQLWRLRCDCGKVIEKPRSDFENKGQVSCGCKRKRGLVDNKRRPHDISGQKFGALTAIALSGKNRYDKPAWLMQCECGNQCKKSLSDIRRCEYYHTRINCGVKANHSDRWLHYPPAPSPYPSDAGVILKKYLPLTESCSKQIDSWLEDEKRDRLIRASWIIAFRRSSGDNFSEIRERRFILKHLRHCSIDVRRKRRLESGFLLDSKEKKIGGTMTDVTLQDYPVLETQGIKLVSAPRVRLKFKRR